MNVTSTVPFNPRSQKKKTFWPLWFLLCTLPHIPKNCCCWFPSPPFCNIKKTKKTWGISFSFRFYHPSGLCLSCLNLCPATSRFHAGALPSWIQRSLSQWARSKLSWISNLDPIFGGRVVFFFNYPNNPDPSKMAILRTRTPPIQVQTLPLEGPRILRVRSKIQGSLNLGLLIVFFMEMNPWLVDVILPETNSQSPWKWAGPQKTIIFQPLIFRGELLVSGSVRDVRSKIQGSLNLGLLIVFYGDESLVSWCYPPWN